MPAIDRTRPHFYGAVADQPVTVAWAATPAGGDIALTLTVGGAANPAEVRKPDLKPLLSGRFQVIAAADPPPAADAVRFAYTLRPVPGAVAEVPALPFAYYRPGFPEGRRFQTAYAEPLAVSVPPPDVPAGFDRLDDRPPPRLAGWAWLVPVLAVPWLVAAGVPLARLLFPDAARLARVRRVAAVRAVLDALTAAERIPDPAGATAAALRRYLAVRPPADRGDFDRLLDRCDAARFGPLGGNDPALALAAGRLVRTAEGVGE